MTVTPTSHRPLALTRIAIGVALLAAAAAAWLAGTAADDLADLHERRATLQPAAVDAAGTPGWLTAIVSAIDPDVRTHDAIGRYWRAEDPALTDAPAGGADSETLLVSANAAFRRVKADAGRAIVPERLDPVLQAYAGVLRNHGFDRDAAYNFEFVARLRDQAARAKPSTARSDPNSNGTRAPAVRQPGGLPDGPTIHGRPGRHPPAMRGEEFEVITPMDFGDRETQPEPTPGVRMPKKG